MPPVTSRCANPRSSFSPLGEGASRGRRGVQVGCCASRFRFQGTGNLELVLDRETSDQRIYPAIDLNRSGTRREELLLTEKELNRVYLLRSFLAHMPAPEAAQFLIERIGHYHTNAEFLSAMAQGY